MKRTIVLVAAITAAHMALRFMALAIGAALPIARLGTVSVWMVRNLDGKNVNISAINVLCLVWLVLAMLAGAGMVRASAPLRVPLALFIAGVAGNASSHVLFGGIIVNPFYVLTSDNWITFNLADITVYLGLFWYVAICLMLFGKELIHDSQQHPSRSGHDVRRGLRGVRRQPDHSL